MKNVGSDAESPSPLGANAACLVCHMTFLEDSLSKVHLRNGMSCASCHGVSAPHANDEEIGRTPPDRSFKRTEVDPFCKKCHTLHRAWPADIVKAWKKLGRGPELPVCTDCHGTHRIEAASEAFGSLEKGKEEASDAEDRNARR